MRARLHGARAAASDAHQILGRRSGRRARLGHQLEARGGERGAHLAPARLSRRLGQRHVPSDDLLNRRVGGQSLAGVVLGRNVRDAAREYGRRREAALGRVGRRASRPPPVRAEGQLQQREQQRRSPRAGSQRRAEAAERRQQQREGSECSQEAADNGKPPWIRGGC